MDLLLVIILVFVFYFLQRGSVMRRIEEINRSHGLSIGGGYVDVLFLIHVLLFAVYFTYALYERSDSWSYWFYTSESEDWFSWWDKDTKFVMFLTWPFSRFLGLSYASCMVLFSYLGFQGGLLFYLAAKENIKGLRPVYRNFTIIELVFLLPNIHFWSSSIGKGAIMLTAIGLIVYGLSRFQKRAAAIIIGGFFVYMIRTHVLFIIILGIGTGLMLTLKGIKWYYKVLLVAVAVGMGSFILGDLGRYTGSNSINIFDNQKLQKRAYENTKATTGVDINNYNQAQKLFTFWYRPLFVDAPGFLGIVVSFENFLYLLFTIQIVRYGLVNWKRWNGWFRISLFIFLFGSIALAQMAANLGLAMRQKAQIMPLFFIVYCKSMSYKGQRKKNG